MAYNDTSNVESFGREIEPEVLDEEEVSRNSGLVGVIEERFNRAETERKFDEDRWLSSYRAYRGIYDPDIEFRDNERSRVFVKITKTKVLAAYGQLIEVVFSGKQFPIGIEPTRVPIGSVEYAHIDPNQKEEKSTPSDPYGYEGDGRKLKPGEVVSSTANELMASLPWTEGEAPDKSKMPQIKPAADAARKMEKQIHDQLEESNAATELRHSIFESVLLGTGVVKGPFNSQKTYHKWSKNPDNGQRQYEPINKLVPKISAVSCWDFYPDPNATNIHNAEWVIQRHKLNRSQLRDLMNRPYFNENAIRTILDTYTQYYDKKWWEDQLRDSDYRDINEDRYEVLEYWGIMDRQLIEEAALDVNSELLDELKEDDLKEVQVNIWVCGNEILRLVLNPFIPARIPYQVMPYEINPYQFFGIGIPENMDDAQRIINGHARMAIDNLAFAGNLVFDIDEAALVPGQDYNIYPGKVFRRQTGMPGQAVYGIKFPSTANENLQLMDRFRVLADEETGIPSYSHGITGVQTTTRTASGMSMLMGAAALSIKTVVKNLDDFLLKPLGEAFFAWNMQFNEDQEIQGDLEVKARGTSSLLQKEVRSQRLMMFMQLAANPQFAPFVKMHTLIKEIAMSLDIEPEDIINDPEQAALYAQIIGLQNAQQGNTTGGQGAPKQPGSVPGLGLGVGGTNPSDATGAGGGTIGTGSVPQSGEDQFSA